MHICVKGVLLTTKCTSSLRAATTYVRNMNCCVRLHAGFYRWSINAFAFARNATAPYKNPIPKFDEPAISMSVPEELEPHRVAIVGESLFVHGQVLVECSRWCCPREVPIQVHSYRALPMLLPRPVRFECCPWAEEACTGLVVSLSSSAKPHALALTSTSCPACPMVQYTRQRSSKPDYGLRDAILLKWYHMLAEQYCAQPYGSWTGNVSLLAAYEARAFAAGEDRCVC